MTTAKGNGAYALPYEKPAEQSTWDTLRLGLYNPSTHQILGRTAKSWASIAVFYSIFYAVLAGFFAICMKGMLYTIDESKPYFQKDRSLIGSSPGLGFRPISDNVEAEGALIFYQARNSSNVKLWTDRVEDFLEPYKNPSSSRNQVNCDFTMPAPPGKVCVPNLENWKICDKHDGYGYNKSSPCVFVKLNRIFGWVPEYYNDTTDLPEAMPDDLKKFISEQPASNRNTVWVSCEGENPADRENIGPIEMAPTRGIPGYFFPYENQEGYLSPLVAIRFVRPKVNVLINIECRAWAKNINYRRHNTLREGSVHFELMVD